MTLQRREKVLAIAVAALVGAFIVQVIVKGVFLGPLTQIDERIVRVKDSIRKKQDKMRAKTMLLARWQDAYKQMIADDPEQAKLKLQSRIDTLVPLAALTGKKITPVAGGAKKGTVALTLSCRGTLSQIVHFFDMLSQEPYMVKVTGFILKPEAKTRLVWLNTCRIEAMVLPPPASKRANPTNGRSIPDPLDEPTSTGRYARIGEKDILHPPTTLAPITRIEEPTTTGPGTRITRSPRRIGPGRPGDLVAVVAAGRTGGIYLRNATGAQWYNLADDVDGYVLEFAHPLGAVLKDISGRYVYVETGDNIDQARPLQADEFVGEHLQKLFDTWREASAGEK